MTISLYIFLLFNWIQLSLSPPQPSTLPQPQIIEYTKVTANSPLLDTITALIHQGDYLKAIELAEKELKRKSPKEESVETRLKLLYIETLNHFQAYIAALNMSLEVEKAHMAYLLRNPKLLKDFYFERGYTYNGLHNQKYEIQYTQKALDIMLANPEAFTPSEFISAFNDLYFYLTNYDDQEGMQRTYEDYLHYYQLHFVHPQVEDFARARRVLRKMQVTEALNQRNPAAATTILENFKQETSLTLEEGDIAYINACYSLINQYYYVHKAYEQAIRTGETYVAFAKQSQSAFNTMLAYSKIAISYQQLGQHEQALKYTDLSIQSFRFEEFNASLYALEMIKAKSLTALNHQQEAISLVESTIEDILTHYLKKKTRIADYAIQDMASLNSHYYINIFATAGLLYIERYKSQGQPADLDKAEKLLLTATAMFKEFYLHGAYNALLYGLHMKNAEGLLFIALQKYAENPVKQQEIVNLIEENASKHLLRNYLYKSGKSMDDGQDFTEMSNIISKVQANLGDDTQLLKYYVLEQSAYLLNIQKHGITLSALGSTENLQDKTVAFTQALRQKQADYADRSLDLAQDIVPQALSKKIIVIWDNFLHYLPFEALTKPESSTPLVLDHQISYAPSLYIHVWNKEHTLGNKSKRTIILNPQYADGSTFGTYQTPNLMASQQEALNIRATTNGTLLTQQVSKEDFLRRAQDYSIFHFSMHAFIDDEQYKNSCLLFSNNEPLYFEDLYEMSIPADMVVLGACNTGNGALKNGEGIMSLSLAFNFAGARATVYSLWEAPDEASSLILSQFYQELKNDATKDEAMQLAKLAFLKAYPMMDHPYFWAGFVINGDDAALYPSTPAYWKWLSWLLLSVLLALGVYYLFTRSKPT